MPRKHCFCPPVSDRNTLYNLLKYNKSFRGRGCGGGDPFAKGSLPHNALLPHNAPLPQKVLYPNVPQRQAPGRPDETVVQSDHGGRVELPAGNANELFGVTPCNASVFAHFPLDFLGIGEQSFMDFFGETVGIDFLMASGDAVEDFLGH